MHGIDLIQDLAVVLIVASLVGWLCHRVGLSVIVGYLGAGMLVGPHTPPFSLVTDPERIETLSQLGLVFLMFGIGMHLSLRRLKSMGLPLMVATVVNTVLIYYLTRVLGAALHWNEFETLFLAAMLMVSSSAIIGKILVEVGMTHENAGQAAMSLTVVEDVVAVVMLTLLTSMARFDGGGGGARIGETIGVMGSFVVLAGIASLLIVPWLLRRLAASVSAELQTLCVAGLLLGLAVIAARAGYSLALGAFLLGCVVAETRQKPQVERSFEGLHDVFSAVFFVAIGMQIDVRMMLDEWALILGVSVFSLFLRPLTCMVGFVVAGTPAKDALRVGLVATPIGEFSLIIAQLGVSLAVVPAKFYPLAVGVSFLTSLAAPLLTRHSGAIAGRLLNLQPRWLTGAMDGYQSWLERVQARGQRNLLWQLCRKRLVQIAVEVLLVSGLLLFSEQMFRLVADYLPVDRSYPRAAELVFWGGLGLITLIPLVAIWRNLSALAMIISDASTAGHTHAAKLKPVVETSLKVAAGGVIFLWLSAIVPFQGMGRWVPVLALGIAGIAVLLLRSRLVYWHSVMVVELRERLEPVEVKRVSTAPWLKEHEEWRLSLKECVLPDLADVRGSTLEEMGLRAKFGVVVAGIDRQGVMIGNPSPGMALFPGDKVLLLGEPKQVEACKLHLRAASGGKQAGASFDEMRMGSVIIPPGSELDGQSLADLALNRKHGLQVAGINRGGLRLLNPGGEERLAANDELLVLGSAGQIADFKSVLQARTQSA